MVTYIATLQIELYV